MYVDMAMHPLLRVVLLLPVCLATVLLVRTATGHA